jgi:VWFA-related protein
MNTYQSSITGWAFLRKTAGWMFAGVLVVLLTCAANGQTTGQTAPVTAPGAAPYDSGLTLKTNVDEVTLDIVIHDKHRKAVLDLKPEDVAVTDNGTPVKLNGFRLVQGDTSAGHAVTLVFDHFEGPLAKSARNIADKILKVLPATGYSFAVMDFHGRLRLLQGFTEDRGLVDSAVDTATESNAVHMTTTLSQGYDIVHDPAEVEKAKVAAQAEKDLISIAGTGADSAGRHVDVKERALAQTLLKAMEDAQQIVQEQHANRELAGILGLVRSQQQLSQRKAIIYFTLNELMDSGSKQMLNTITGTATKAGVTIYTVDLDAMNLAGRREVEQARNQGEAGYNPTPIVVNAHGDTAIVPQQEGGAGVVGTPSPNGPVWGQAQDLSQMSDFARGNNEDPNQYLEIKSPMSDLSKNTGGTYVDAQLSVRGPLQQLVQDMSTYYEATYTPPVQEYDGKFRTIAVKPLRTGLTVQAKTGYFSVPPGTAGGMRPFEAALLKSLKAPELPADFKFNASIIRFGSLPDGNTNTLAVEVPYSALDLKPDTHTGLYSAHASIVAQIKDSGGTVIEHFAEDIARRGGLESVDRDKTLAITLQRHFMEIPGKYVLEVAVKDQNSEKMSAQRVPFEIPAVPNGPALSDMVLVRKMDTFSEDSDPLEPMQYEKEKVTPNLTGTVLPDAKSVSLFMILHPDPKATQPPTLEMQVIRNGNPGRRTPLPLRVNSVGGTLPYLATFPKALAPGNYLVRATLNQGGSEATQEVWFSVEGKPGESVAADSTGHGGGGAPVEDISLTSGNLPGAAGELAITASSKAIPPPTPEEVQTLISDARQRAVNYMNGLPNFMCIEVTDRSLDPAGRGLWKHKDTITELLRFRDKAESRSVMEVDGRPAASMNADDIKGTQSTGEFGAVLHTVFDPSAKAEFKWKETDTLGNGTVQVFDYHVSKENSNFTVRGSNGLEPTVSFHGKVYIDTATSSVRRISLIADDFPKDFPTHASTVSVDYDYVSINSHDYLMPISAEVSVLQGRHFASLNTIAFRDYRRFGSNLKILNFRTMEKP